MNLHKSISFCNDDHKSWNNYNTASTYVLQFNRLLPFTFSWTLTEKIHMCPLAFATSSLHYEVTIKTKLKRTLKHAHKKEKGYMTLAGASAFLFIAGLNS